MRKMKFTKHYDSIITTIISTFNVWQSGNYNKVAVNGMWDTGADHTFISKRLVDKLELKPFKQIIITHSGGNMLVPVFQIDLAVIDNENTVMTFYSIEAGMSVIRSEVDLLIGMDIISQGDFSISNSSGKTIFTFEYSL